MEMRLSLDRDDIGFAAAHFSILADRVERLHGHNYRVALEAAGATGEGGAVAEFGVLKQALRAECATLHERTLIAARSPRLRIDEGPDEVTVVCDERTYRLPREDVVLLPVVNTTCECLAALLLERLRGRLGKLPIRLTLRVEERPGQGASAAE